MLVGNLLHANVYFVLWKSIFKAFQFVEEHGEVCPANWKPGAKTINPAKASDYFESAN